MRLTAILLLAGLGAGARGFSQITLSEKNTPLRNVFKKIQQQSGYEFLYPADLVEKAGTVTVEVRDVTLEDALDATLAGKGLSFVISDRSVIIRQSASPPGLPLDTGRVGAIRVRGVVYNESGQPLSGANVVIKESEKGTITDAKGAFDLGQIPVGSTIIVSFIGYERQTITVKDAANLVLYLKVTHNQLDGVVVQAYGVTSQRLTTGSMSVVTSEQLERQPVSNPIEALQGQVPGLLIQETNGNTTAPFKVEIRGRNSINSNFTSDPLYVIDGVPLIIASLNGASNYGDGSQGFDQTGMANTVGAGGQSPFFSVNPSDIESITILKDADATAIYGSRGANGVILITTKKGKAGKTKLDINVYQGITAVTRQWNMMNTSQYLFMRSQALANDGLAPSVGTDPDLLVWDTTKYTNWQKYLWGNLGKVTDAQASLSGGDARTTFRISADYRRQTDISTLSGADQRAAFSLNLGHKGLNQRFSVEFTANYSFIDANMVNISGPVTTAPDAPPVYDALGYLNWDGWAPAQAYYPFSSLLVPYNGETYFLTTNLVGGYQIFKGLTAKFSLGYNNMTGSESLFEPIASQNPQLDPTGIAQFGANQMHGWIAEPQVEYNGYLGKGKLDVLAGGTDNAAFTGESVVSGTGYTSDFLLRSISAAPSVTSTASSGQDKFAAVFARANYNWESKYILNITARRDGSSRFAPGNEYGNFGSAGAAWIFSEESWVKSHMTFLSFGKIRASYGLTGSDNIPDYQYFSAYTSNRVTYNGQSSLYPSQMGDSTYHWQVNKKAEIALDLGFLKDRITMEAAVYRDRCNDQLLPYPTPEFTGFTSVIANSAANVQNLGEEFTLNATPLDLKNFKWTVNFHISGNQNKLLSFRNLAQSPYADVDIVGYTLNFVRLLHYVGVDPLTGQYAYLDRNHDGAISINPGPTDDRTPYNINPKYYGGLTNTFSYKGFQLSFFFYFKKQIGQNALFTENAGLFDSNEPAYIFGRQWQHPGDKATFARFTTNSQLSDSYFDVSDGYYTDASYIRLKNLSLMYTLPSRVLQKSGIQNLSVYLRGENLFLITDYKGLDPETQNFGGMPPQKIFTMGIVASF